MNLDNAKIGWEKTWRASGKAKSTLILYSGFLGQLSGYLKNPEISDITLEKLEDYFIYLQEEYIPKRKFGVIKRLSGSSLANHWKAIRSIMKWCIERKFMLENDDPSLKLNCPKAVNEAVDPLSKAEVEAIFNEINKLTPVQPRNRSPFVMKRRTTERDIAMVLVLLDTGIRVGELCRLNIGDYNQKDSKIYIRQYGNSTIKTIARIINLPDLSDAALWNYLSRRKVIDSNEPLFVDSIKNERIKENAIRDLLERIGMKAGIKHLHPHRFRHTFSIEFLNNGGNIYSLQDILGNCSIDICRTYLKKSNADVAGTQKKFSPSQGWKLSPFDNKSRRLINSNFSNNNRL